MVGINANTFAEDWSPDGKLVVYSDSSEKTKNDLWMLPMEGDRKPVRFLQTPFNERSGQFSADGKWLAYESDESGGYQIYVQPVSPDGRRWQISTAGGSQPRWSRDGRELFFVTGGQTLMAVPSRSEPVSSRARLAPFLTGFHQV